jgi:hypothetical protein
LARAQQALKKVRGFDEIAAIVFTAERYGGTGAPIHEMGEMAMITRRALQEIEHRRQSRDCFLSRDPSSFRRDDHGHDAETRTTDRDEIVLALGDEANAITRKPASFMSPVPKKEECLSLHKIE